MRTVDLDSLYDDQLECWIRKEEDDYLLGITDWTQGYIGDISHLHIEVETDSALSKESPFAIIESQKTSIELRLPVSGIIVRINDYVLNAPALINSDCYARSNDEQTRGWILRIKVSGIKEINELLTPCLLYTSPSPRDRTRSRMPSSA